MTGFVDNTNYTRSFAASEIVEIGEAKSRAGRHGTWHDAKLRDGTHISIHADTAAELSDPVVAVIPATAGYSAIGTGNLRDGTPWTWREAVLAWRVRASGGIEPVTVRAAYDGRSQATMAAIELPSGDIWSAEDDAFYDDFDAFRAAQLEKSAQKTGAN